MKNVWFSEQDHNLDSIFEKTHSLKNSEDSTGIDPLSLSSGYASVTFVGVSEWVEFNAPLDTI